MLYSNLSGEHPTASQARNHTGREEMRDQVQAALDKMRPTLQKDGGDVVLVDVSAEGVVKVQLTGACKSCPMSGVTIKNGIEKFLKAEVAEVTAVVAV